MKKRNFFILLLLVQVLVATHSCKKEKNENEQPAQTNLEDEASPAAQAFLAGLAADEVDLRDIILPNGENLIDFALENDREFMSQNAHLLPEQYRSLFTANGQRTSAVNTNNAKGPQTIKNITILRYQVIGNYLITDALHSAMLNDGKKPEQTHGLAYALGSKYIKDRRAGDGCTELVRGLDCSGMLAYIVNGALAPNGGNAPLVLGKAVHQSDTTNWKNALSAAGPEFSKMKAQRYTSSEVPVDSIQTGDVVFFYEGPKTISHIGMALVGSDGKVRLFQSNGSSSTCTENYTSANKGPREIPLSNPFSWKIFTDYGVVRLVTDISGDWTAFIRCEGEITDAIELAMKIPAKDGGKFISTGTGTDYDGDPINVLLEGSYDKKKNELSGVFTLTSATADENPRKDEFTITLNKDETPYFSLTKVLDNEGCNTQMRLLNKEVLSTQPVSNRSSRKSSNSFFNPGAKKPGAR